MRTPRAPADESAAIVSVPYDVTSVTFDVCDLRGRLDRGMGNHRIERGKVYGDVRVDLPMASEDEAEAMALFGFAE